MYAGKKPPVCIGCGAESSSLKDFLCKGCHDIIRSSPYGKNNKCIDCGTRRRRLRCSSCSKLYRGLNKNHVSDYVGRCKICGEAIHGKEGTYVKSIGSAHKSCSEEKWRIAKLAVG